MGKETETGLMLPVGSPSAKAIMLLRKLTPLAIAEIRQRAAEGRPITGFEDRDEYGIRDDEVLLRSVRRACKELLSLGVDARIVIDGREEGASYLDNVIHSMRETAEQLDWGDTRSASRRRRSSAPSPSCRRSSRTSAGGCRTTCTSSARS